MRQQVHRDKHCPTHVDVALIETTSGDQLVCPRFDCDGHLKLVDGKWRKRR